MADEQQAGAGEGGGPGPSEAEPNEAELRAQLEDEIRKVKIEDVILQSVVSILNLAARRIAKDDERDLEQGKLGIDAASALVRLVPDEAQPQLRQAISELQLLYAKHAEGGEAAGEAGEDEGGDGGEKPAAKPDGPKKDEGGSGLWTPSGS